MQTNEVCDDRGVAQAILNRIVSVAEAVAGGPLAALHTREAVPGLAGRIKAAVTPLCAELLRALTAPTSYLQDVPNIRIHRPHDLTSVTPFHSDVLYGHSMDEVNYWIALTPAFATNSLWLVEEAQTESLHAQFRTGRLSLAEFERRARESAVPLEVPKPSIHTFCCGRVHGSVLNETEATRVSIDLRVLNEGGRAGVKKRGAYFRPRWLPESVCPLPAGTPVTTVASLDEPAPVYLQRMAMETFYPQGPHRELVEFYGVDHNPTLADSMLQGPVLAYSVRQLKVWEDLVHPIGFVDERMWFRPDQKDLLARLIREIGD
jgi:hypothetical protein